LANTVKRWLQIISIKVLFSHISLLEMGLWDKYASLFILFPYTYAEAQSHGICNFVCTLTYSTPPKISRLMFHVQSYPALLVAMAWNCSSECNGNNLESLSFLTLCRMLTVCVQRLQLNVSLQSICWWSQTIVQFMRLSQRIKTSLLHNTPFYL